MNQKFIVETYKYYFYINWQSEYLYSTNMTPYYVMVEVNTMVLFIDNDFTED